MELTLLGTGAPEGLPRPSCPCAVCARARGSWARAATALLVDDALLLDLTPGAVFAAARAGHSLSAVRQVLLTHPHDGPAVELPPTLPPAGRVPDGQVLTLISGHRVRAVPMDAPGTGYEVGSPDGERLLYLPPGAAPAGLDGRAERPYDLVVCDVVGRPDAVARLRAVGAVGPATEVIAVHLDHDAPPGAALDRLLAAAGARAVPDGTTLAVGEYPVVPDVPRRVLVTGAPGRGSLWRRSGGWRRSPRWCTWRPAGGAAGTRSGRPGWRCTGSAGRARGGPRRPASWWGCWRRRGRRC